MAHEMYFIPILLDAFDAPKPREALRQAFGQIETLGRQPGYETGYAQFREFMRLVAQDAGDRESNEIEAEVLEALALVLERPEQREELVKVLEDQPMRRQQYEQLMQALKLIMPDQHSLEVIVQRREETVAAFDMLGTGMLGRLGGISPDSYRFLLSTGRVLWEGELSSSDLLLSGRPLQLAADTGDTVAAPSREIPLLGGEVVIHVHQGIESGTLTIERMR